MNTEVLSGGAMRDKRIDNIRSILIFLVVLGHFFEPSQSTSLMYAAEFIYSFHMPVFVFISGYLAKFNPKRIVRTYLYSYLLLQTVYIFFNKFFLEKTDTALDFSNPHHSLWYLLAMAMYCLIIPLIETDRRSKKMIIFAISLFISLFAGTDWGIDETFTLGRFFGFLPFFVLGYYMREESFGERIKKWSLSLKILFAVFLGIVIAFAEFFIVKTPHITILDMYFSHPYYQTGGGAFARLILLAVGFLWIGFLFMIIPKKSLPIISKIGANTFPVYIFHGLAVKVLLKYGLINLEAAAYMALTVVLSATLVLLFGNKTASAVAKWVFTGHWIGALEKKFKR